MNAKNLFIHRVIIKLKFVTKNLSKFTYDSLKNLTNVLKNLINNKQIKFSLFSAFWASFANKHKSTFNILKNLEEKTSNLIKNTKPY